MATFQAKIEDLTGSIGDTDALTQWLTDGAKEIINILPPQLKIKASTRSTLNTSAPTLDLDNADGSGGNLRGEVLHVTRLSADSGGFEKACREIPGMFGDLTNDSTDLMHYATATDPVYFITNNSSGHPTLFVKPTTTDAQPANVYRIAYPSVAYDDSVIANFPNEAEYLVVLYAAIKGLHRLMNNKNNELPAFVSPVIPDVPSFTYTDVSVSDIIKPIVELADKTALTASAPVYNSPSFSPPEFPILPDAPTVPVLMNSSISVVMPTSVPTYTKPNVSLDFGDADNWITVEEDNEMLQARTTMIGSQINSYNADITNELNNFNKENAEYQAELQKAIKDTELLDTNDTKKIQLFQAEVQLFQNRVTNKINEYSTKFGLGMQDYTAKIQVELNKYNESVVVYNEDITRKSENFQKDINVASANAESQLANSSKNLEKNTQVGLQNALSNYKKDVEEYAAKLQKYQNELNGQVQSITASIQLEQVDYGWLQTQYAQLKQDYNQGITILVGGGAPQPSKQEGE